MIKLGASKKDIQLSNGYTDVLLLTNQSKLPEQLGRLLAGKKLVWSKVAIEKFGIIKSKLDLIGTVIIDGSEFDSTQNQNFNAIIKTLESANIATIVLNNWTDFSSGKFVLASAVESTSIEELWGRIAANLAYRKKLSTGIQKAGNEEHQTADDGSIHAGYNELQEQLKMAGRVQRDFLPRHLPGGSGIKWSVAFSPAEWVSGDIYDIRRLDEQHIGFYIADAVGHSMPAALLTIFLKHAMVMRETLDSDYRIFCPADVMKKLNERMAEQKLSGCRFATCCYCLLNIRTLQLTYARAGHPYPVLIRAGEEPVQLESRGMLLGFLDDAEFVQETVQLHSGDKLFLYSDGAEEIVGKFEDKSGFNFSDEFNSIKNLPVEKMIDRFNVMVKNYKTKPAEIDDITAIGLEIM